MKAIKFKVGEEVYFLQNDTYNKATIFAVRRDYAPVCDVDSVKYAISTSQLLGMTVPNQDSYIPQEHISRTESGIKRIRSKVKGWC